MARLSALGLDAGGDRFADGLAAPPGRGGGRCPRAPAPGWRRSGARGGPDRAGGPDHLWLAGDLASDAVWGRLPPGGGVACGLVPAPDPAGPALLCGAPHGQIGRASWREGEMIG